MNIIDELNFYDEKMLRLQYEISECFTHQLTKGQVREEFIKDYIKKKIQKIEIYKGQIFEKDKTSTQLDIVICDENAICNKLGKDYLIEAKDCKKIFEVKSKLNSKYLKELCNVAKELKLMNKKIKVGMFAYTLENSMKSIVRNFGYIYDKKLDMYDYKSEQVLTEYKNIDYIICLDENNEFVLINENGKFAFYNDVPVIKYLWPILQN